MAESVLQNYRYILKQQSFLNLCDKEMHNNDKEHFIYLLSQFSLDIQETLLDVYQDGLKRGKSGVC